ncbi:MAG: GNAT family N-acetyltransferase [bacterium]|nr:GNAT family N-acetyltransferase [bacterium]
MITIDEVRIFDIQAVSEVLKTVWVDTYHSFLSPETMMKVTEFWLDPEMLKNQIMNPEVLFLAAKDETGAIVGIATAMHIEPTTLQLARLFVLPAKQRQGIGTLLLEHVVKKIEYIKTIRTEVEENNMRGICFCTKHGFKKVGTKQDIVEDTILLAIVMEKKL